MFLLILIFLNKGECLTAYEFVFSEWPAQQNLWAVMLWEMLSAPPLKQHVFEEGLERLSVFLERLFAQQKCINVSWPVSASERSLQEPVWLQMYELKRLAITEFLTDALAWFSSSGSSCRAEAAHTGTQSDFYTTVQFLNWDWARKLNEGLQFWIQMNWNLKSVCLFVWISTQGCSLWGGWGMGEVTPPQPKLASTTPHIYTMVNGNSFITF